MVCPEAQDTLAVLFSATLLQTSLEVAAAAATIESEFVFWLAVEFDFGVQPAKAVTPITKNKIFLIVRIIRPPRQ